MNLSRLLTALFNVAAPLAILSIAANAFGAEAESYSKLDPCSLVARAEVENMVGELKEAPKPDTGLQQEKECNYTNKEGAWLKASIYSSQRWGMQKGIVSEMNPTPIEGVGDEAFGVKRGSSYEVYVLKGKLILEVSSSAGADVARQFAAAAAKQLP